MFENTYKGHNTYQNRSYRHDSQHNKKQQIVALTLFSFFDMVLLFAYLRVSKHVVHYFLFAMNSFSIDSLASS